MFTVKLASVVAALALVGTGPAFAHPHDKPETVSSKPDKVVCKRLVETGSLVRGAKTCKTRAEWDRHGEMARRQVQEIQDSSLINSSRPN